MRIRTAKTLFGPAERLCLVRPSPIPAGIKDIGKIILAGSTGAGPRIMASAAETMKRLTLELGGNDAGIFLPDVDPKPIAERLYVPDDV